MNTEAATALGVTAGPAGARVRLARRRRSELDGQRRDPPGRPGRRPGDGVPAARSACRSCSSARTRSTRCWSSTRGDAAQRLARTRGRSPSSCAPRSSTTPPRAACSAPCRRAPARDLLAARDRQSGHRRACYPTSCGGCSRTWIGQTRAENPEFKALATRTPRSWAGWHRASGRRGQSRQHALRRRGARRQRLSRHRRAERRPGPGRPLGQRLHRPVRRARRVLAVQRHAADRARLFAGGARAAHRAGHQPRAGRATPRRHPAAGDRGRAVQPDLVAVRPGRRAGSGAGDHRRWPAAWSSSTASTWSRSVEPASIAASYGLGVVLTFVAVTADGVALEPLQHRHRDSRPARPAAWSRRAGARCVGSVAAAVRRAAAGRRSRVAAAAELAYAAGVALSIVGVALVARWVLLRAGLARAGTGGVHAGWAGADWLVGAAHRRSFRPSWR